MFWCFANPIVAMTEGSKMQTEIIAFRAAPVLVQALEAKAAASGCSVSEYLRSLVREKAGLQ